MWCTFLHNNGLYMVKLIQSDNLVLHLTDLKNLWIQNLSKEVVLEQFQEFNPLIDIKVEDAVEEIINIIKNISDFDVDISECNENRELTIKYLKSEFTLQYKFNLQKSSADMFLKEVTVPLIQTVKHLEECKNMLCNVVYKKDRELEEYKLEKGHISRDDLVTEKFDENSLGTLDDKSMINVFGRSKIFWDSFVHQHGKIETEIENIKRDPWNHIKRKRKVYSSRTAMKKGKGIKYEESK